MRSSEAIDGATLLPIPHRNTPSLRDLSASFRAKISEIVWPASVPNLVQQNAFGIVIRASLLAMHSIHVYSSSCKTFLHKFDRLSMGAALVRLKLPYDAVLASQQYRG
tara:strand:+ start:17712 stop:18035 length:324 start_codon:yes stop_codon:yes gene_type:complete